MKRLGISIYPEKSDREQLLDYLERASPASSAACSR